MISIIMPTHNRPKDMAKNIKVIRCIKNYELIIMENGSSKKSKEEYKKIPLLKNEKIFFSNIGSLPIARNQGVHKAAGEYIFHLDDDDTLTKEFVR